MHEDLDLHTSEFWLSNERVLSKQPLLLCVIFRNGPGKSSGRNGLQSLVNQTRMTSAKCQQDSGRNLPHRSRTLVLGMS